VAGVVLSHRIEPGVVVRKVTLAGDTPALRFAPAQSGPCPLALLGHGAFCSKEMFFRYGEALALAGFECIAVDFPGHGESPQQFTLPGLVRSLEVNARALGPVDVYIGHSMGGYVGGEAARQGRFRPRLLIAIGSLPQVGKGGPPLLLMAGTLDPFAPPAQIRARSDARIKLFSWCDHLLELYDPRLVNAAVEAACATVGRTPPAPPFCWRWRLAGVALGWLGAAGLAKVALVLCRASSGLALLRAPLFSFILLGANAAVMGTWIGAIPHLQRLPWQICAGAVVWLALTGLARLRIPRWSILALASAVTVTGATAHWPITLLLGVFFVGALLAGTICGEIAAARGSKRDGDLTLAIFAGYVVGQWMIRFV